MSRRDSSELINPVFAASRFSIRIVTVDDFFQAPGWRVVSRLGVRAFMLLGSEDSDCNVLIDLLGKGAVKYRARVQRCNRA